MTFTLLNLLLLLLRRFILTWLYKQSKWSTPTSIKKILTKSFMINPNMIDKHGIFQKQLLGRFGAIVHHWCSSFDEKFLLTQTGVVVLTGMNKNWKMQLHNHFPMTMMIWLIRDLLLCYSPFCSRGKGSVVYFWICYQCGLNYKTFCKLSWTFYADFAGMIIVEMLRIKKCQISFFSLYTY